MTARPAKRSRGRSLLGRIAVVVGVVLALVIVVQWLALKPYRIPSLSMAPTLEPGQRILVNRLSTQFGSPKVGDIVVFHPPAGADLADGSESCAVVRRPDEICSRPREGKADVAFVKRVVGLAGDRIVIRHGQVIRNGQAQREPFAQRCALPICELRAFTVPRGSILVLGDNRDDSNDSRYWGALPTGDVIGKAVATYWPPDRAGGL